MCDENKYIYECIGPKPKASVVLPSKYQQQKYNIAELIALLILTEKFNVENGWQNMFQRYILAQRLNSTINVSTNFI